MRPRNDDHPVVIAGGGPTGLMLAAELRLAGCDAIIVEPRLDQHVDGSRAGGLHARTLEVLDQRGVVERFVAAGQRHPALAFSQVMLSVTDLPSPHNYVLGLFQQLFEPMLAEWVLDELGAPIVRGRSVTGLTQDDDGVELVLSDGSTMSCRYLVGCDGGRSAVRRSAGIEFAGLDASTSWMIAEVETTEPPEFGFRRDATGTHAIGPSADGVSVRVVLTEPGVERTGEPTLDELRAALVETYGTDFGLRRARWSSRFTDMSRQAVGYRSGRVLLAGDAAHVHPPQGGQGLNTGVQDAVNLGWKLARVVAGVCGDDLLDTYHSERHPVGARVLHNTMAQVALAAPDRRHDALRDIVGDVLTMDGPRRCIAAMIAGLDIRYDMPGQHERPHPLLGHRMPDLALHTASGATRLFKLLRPARPFVLVTGPPGAVDLSGWEERVDLVPASCNDVWELPVIGRVDPVSAVLVRPDGHVAWVGERTDAGLVEAMSRWFGPPAPPSTRRQTSPSGAGGR
jgi:3-(3-hydroxy-phenyl)propionate hydroxylase